MPPIHSLLHFTHTHFTLSLCASLLVFSPQNLNDPDIRLLSASCSPDERPADNTHVTTYAMSVPH
jgi:hypothetical protein